MGKVKSLFVLFALSSLTGCFQIQGVHVLRDYGDSDSGSYRITMSAVTYNLLNSNDKYSDEIKQLRSWSRPTTRFDGNLVHIEDTSGTAAMEHAYDSHTCTPSVVRNYMECRFILKLSKDDAAMLPGWAIDWEVVVQPDMRLLVSNHQRIRHENGRDHLIWSFDYNDDSEANIDFTVMVPRGD